MKLRLMQYRKAYTPLHSYIFLTSSLFFLFFWGFFVSREISVNKSFTLTAHHIPNVLRRIENMPH